MTTHLYTRHYVSPYQVSMEMRVSRADAMEMLSDTSGSDYTRDVFGTRFTLDPVARTLTASLIDDVPQGETSEPARVSGRTYAFYVGSTGDYDAHTVPDGHPALVAGLSRMGNVENTRGVWGGETENVAIYRGDFASDDIAHRIAYAVTRATGNDCVLVTRERGSGDYGAMCANNRFIARMVMTTEGNRTLFADFHGGIVEAGAMGSRLEPDVTGFHVAWLVNADATVSAVA